MNSYVGKVLEFDILNQATKNVKGKLQTSRIRNVEAGSVG